MNWFQQNRFLGIFLAGFSLATLLAFVFLLHEKGVAEDEETRLETTAAELNRLRLGKPFPNPSNLRRTRTLLESYRDSLGRLEHALQERTLSLQPLQPNEFQAQLRQALNNISEQAAANKVQLPEHFALGFEEYATSLPNAQAAPLLGRELKALEMLVGGIISAHVDAIGSLTRAPLPEENGAPTPAPPPTRGRSGASFSPPPAVVLNHAVELTYSAGPAAARRALNDIANAKEQLFVIRRLNVRNPLEKIPKAAAAAEAAATATPAPSASPAPDAPPGSRALQFIVGTEHINVDAVIDIVTLPPSAATR